MSIRSEFRFALKKPPQTDGLRWHAREFADMIENSPGPGDTQAQPTGVQTGPGRGVSGESSN